MQTMAVVISQQGDSEKLETWWRISLSLEAGEHKRYAFQRSAAGTLAAMVGE
jgi:hypothetical protein